MKVPLLPQKKLLIRMAERIKSAAQTQFILTAALSRWIQEQLFPLPPTFLRLVPELLSRVLLFRRMQLRAMMPAFALRPIPSQAQARLKPFLRQKLKPTKTALLRFASERNLPYRKIPALPLSFSEQIRLTLRQVPRLPTRALPRVIMKTAT